MTEVNNFFYESKIKVRFIIDGNSTLFSCSVD